MARANLALPPPSWARALIDLSSLMNTVRFALEANWGPLASRQRRELQAERARIKELLRALDEEGEIDLARLKAEHQAEVGDKIRKLRESLWTP